MVVMLLFRMWAVLSACRVLPAWGVLHPGCCFYGIVAHPLGYQESWAKKRWWLPEKADSPVCQVNWREAHTGAWCTCASSSDRRTSLVHVFQHDLCSHHILPSCQSDALCSPRRNSAALKKRACVKCCFFQIFIIIVQYLYLVTFSL